MSKSYKYQFYGIDDNYVAWKKRRQQEQEEREYRYQNNDYNEDEEMYEYKMRR